MDDDLFVNAPMFKLRVRYLTARRQGREEGVQETLKQVFRLGYEHLPSTYCVPLIFADEDELTTAWKGGQEARMRELPVFAQMDSTSYCVAADIRESMFTREQALHVVGEFGADAGEFVSHFGERRSFSARDVATWICERSVLKRT